MKLLVSDTNGAHALRYHGLFAPNARDRARMMPAGRGAVRPGRPAAGPPDQVEQAVPAVPALPLLPGAACPSPGREPRSRVPWAELLRKVFAIDVLACPECAGRVEVVAYVASVAVACCILDHLGMDSRGPPVAPATGPDEPAPDPGPDYDRPDPAYEG